MNYVTQKQLHTYQTRKNSLFHGKFSSTFHRIPTRSRTAALVYWYLRCVIFYCRISFYDCIHLWTALAFYQSFFYSKSLRRNQKDEIKNLNGRELNKEACEMESLGLIKALCVWSSFRSCSRKKARKRRIKLYPSDRLLCKECVKSCPIKENAECLHEVRGETIFKLSLA